MSAMIRTPRRRPPTTPGEMLAEEFLKPLGMTQKELEHWIHISPPCERDRAWQAKHFA